MDIVQLITQGNDFVNSLVWGIPMLILIIGTGIYMTVRTKFFQIIKAKYVSNETFFAIFKKRSVTKSKEKKAISQFQALSTALAATIGTGNIAGVATAIAIGGPGAVFWMWISAFFGMMTNYSENVLGIYYRKKNTNGEWSGGAMYYLENGLGSKKNCKKLGRVLAIIFAVFCVFASFGIGNMTQINSISSAISSSFSVPTIVTGIALAVIAALVIIGGIKRIASVTEKLVPFMACAYIIAAVTIFVMNYEQIPYVFSSIFSSAFALNAVAGGAVGAIVKQAVTMGFKRGVFSNEAGLGSSVMVHSASDVKEPVIQGMWGIFEVFFDTIIVCTLTAFILLSSTTGAQPFDKVMQNISTETQYCEIANAENYEGDIPLIDSRFENPIVLANEKTPKEMIEQISAKTIYGQEFTVDIIKRNSDYNEDSSTYTNIMAVTGVAQKNKDGSVAKDSNGNPIIGSVKIEKVEGVPLVTYAISQRFGSFAGQFLSIAILLFAFSTVLGWSFYGTKSVEYLFGKKGTIVYKIIFVAFIVVGATMSLDLAWDIADTLNGLMAIPNLIGVLALSGIVIKITNNYVKRKATQNPDNSVTPMLSAYDDIQSEQLEKLNEEEKG